jgi:hypothetical protein
MRILRWLFESLHDALFSFLVQFGAVQMLIQYSTTHRTNNMTDIVTDLGTTPFLLIYTGSVPANCATAASGTLLATLSCSNPFGSVSLGVLTANSITNTTAAATGTAGYWRLATTSGGTTVVAQGTIFPSLSLTTNALTAANGNVLNFASTTGVAVGMTVSGTGVPTNATVVATSSTTVTLSYTSTAGVANAATITFGGDLTLNSTAISSGQTVSVSAMAITATGA